MPKVNPHFKRIKREIIFPVIEKKMAELSDVDLVNLGIGDVALPLTPAIAAALKAASEEMTQRPIGYGPAAGYDFLRNALATEYYDASEIFISDGINSDLAGLLDLFDPSCRVGVVDPGYPVFGDSALMTGRSVTLLPCVEEHGFIPQPPQEHLDVIYLCSPANPTGVAMTRSDLQMWIEYAKAHDAVILFDAAYAAFATSDDVPQSIYAIPGAREVAIEMKSFSKSHGFTGLRCAYCVIPKETQLMAMWQMRQNTKYNGCPYVVQKGALAALSCPDAARQVREYLACAAKLKNITGAYGGVDSPYLWWKVPDGLSSWEFFDQLLYEQHIVSIPGAGFGPHGEGYVRLSAFTTMQHVEKVIERMHAHAD